MSLKAGGSFELFGGNVRGKVEEVDAPTRLVQSWQTRSPGWPEGKSRFSFATVYRAAMSVDGGFLLRSLRDDDDHSRSR